LFPHHQTPEKQLLFKEVRDITRKTAIKARVRENGDILVILPNRARLTVRSDQDIEELNPRTPEVFFPFDFLHVLGINLMPLNKVTMKLLDFYLKPFNRKRL